MPERPVILAIAGDPGGAAALAPVLEHLHQAGEVKVQALAYREAVRTWAAAAFPWAECPAGLDEPGLDELAGGAALLLAGTSGPNGLDYEKRLVSAFRKLNRPSLVLVDYWANYGRRFASVDGRLAYVPDRVTAIDEESRAGLIAAGVPAERVVVTGHPGLDDLHASSHRLGAPERRTIREALGLADEEKLIVFASHPIVAGRTTHEERQAAIECLASALEGIAQPRGMSVALVIRPHPKETSGPYPQERSRARVRVYWSGAGESRQVALAAEGVAGVESMFLVEAYHMGRPTVAIRLGTADESAHVAGVPTVRDEQSLRKALTRMLEDADGDRAGPANRSSAGAVARVTALVHDMLAKQQSAHS